MSTVDDYRRALRKAGRDEKKGVLSREEFDALTAELWDEYLVGKHLADGSLDIFYKVMQEAKNKYAAAKDAYYLGKLNIKEYIALRGNRVGEGVSWYDYRLHELGLATDVLSLSVREDFSWKSLKIERSIMPEETCRSALNMFLCPTQNAEAAKQTLRLLFEVMDYFHEHFVPTLADARPIRDKAWIEIAGEEEAYDLPYLEVEVTPAERQQFEEWRDGFGRRLTVRGL